MKNYFSIGELAEHQKISRQTLIYYDKIGLFCPEYVDPDNGYRYYSANQMDYLDTILIMKKIGFSLEKIKEHMKTYRMEDSILALSRQVAVIEAQIEELSMIRGRVEQRLHQMEKARKVRLLQGEVFLEEVDEEYLLLQEVEAPYSMDKISLATKQCFAGAFERNLPVYFQSGAIVPLERILAGRETEAGYVFLPIEPVKNVEGVCRLPAGTVVCTYHVGDYLSVGPSYQRLLKFCREESLEILSDSYEFAMNDYLSTKDEAEYITKLMVYVKLPKKNRKKESF